MVVIFAFAALETGVMQERTGCPPRCTVQAPHWPIPQPYFVPGRFSTSLSTHDSGVSAGTSTVCDRPFTVNLIVIAPFPKISPFQRACSALMFLPGSGPFYPWNPRSIEVARGWRKVTQAPVL